jgi:CheY-like chemotaxis protein
MPSPAAAAPYTGEDGRPHASSVSRRPGTPARRRRAGTSCTCRPRTSTRSPAAGTDRPASNVEKPLEGVRVLLVDDHDDTRELFAEVLMHAGAEVRDAAGSIAAVRTALEWPPNVVVSDLVMHGTDGFSLLRELRSMHHLVGIPAIAVSGMASHADREVALAAGFQDHLAKPLSPDALVACVARWAVVDGPFR